MQKPFDYGTSWRILRPSLLMDQIYIKVARIRSIEEQGTQWVDEKQDIEYVGLVNYAIFAQITWSESESWSFKIE